MQSKKSFVKKQMAFFVIACYIFHVVEHAYIPPVYSNYNIKPGNTGFFISISLCQSKK